MIHVASHVYSELDLFVGQFAVQSCACLVPMTGGMVAFMAVAVYESIGSLSSHSWVRVPTRVSGDEFMGHVSLTVLSTNSAESNIRAFGLYSGSVICGSAFGNRTYSSTASCLYLTFEHEFSFQLQF